MRIAEWAGCAWCICWCLSAAQRPRPSGQQSVEGHHERARAIAPKRWMATAQWPWGDLYVLWQAPLYGQGQGQGESQAMGSSRPNRTRQRGGQHSQATRSGVCDCPNRRLKLTLPIHKETARPPRAVQLNKVNQPQGRPMLNSHVTSRLINAVRWVAKGEKR